MKTYRCALITGASAGLGEEFARQLAPHCGDMVLVARRAERLAQLAQELERETAVRVHLFVADLADPLQRRRLAATLQEEGLPVDLLINNAGLGDYGSFADAAWEKLQQTLRVNVEALTHLSHLFVPTMLARGGGAILQVSSIASLMPMADFAVYAASKAYVTSFTEALRAELRGHGIVVTALCPGPVKTEFGAVARRQEEDSTETGVVPWFYVDKQQVVAEALSGLERDRPRVYPGWKMAAVALGLGLIPLAVMRLIQESRPRRM